MCRCDVCAAGNLKVHMSIHEDRGSSSFARRGRRMSMDVPPPPARLPPPSSSSLPRFDAPFTSALSGYTTAPGFPPRTAAGLFPPRPPSSTAADLFPPRPPSSTAASFFLSHFSPHMTFPPHLNGFLPRPPIAPPHVASTADGPVFRPPPNRQTVDRMVPEQARTADPAARSAAKSSGVTWGPIANSGVRLTVSTTFVPLSVHAAQMPAVGALRHLTCFTS